MSLFSAPFNVPEPVRVILGTSDTTEIVQAGDAKQAVGKIHVCNTTAAAVTVDIEVHDDTTVYYLEKGHTLGANESYEILDEVLQVGHSLWVKASIANALHVSVIYSAAIR